MRPGLIRPGLCSPKALRASPHCRPLPPGAAPQYNKYIYIYIYIYIYVAMNLLIYIYIYIYVAIFFVFLYRLLARRQNIEA